MKKSPPYKSFLFMCSALILLAISEFYSDEVLYRYHVIFNGRALDEQFNISNDFVITERRGNVIALIRDIGHQHEQVVLSDSVNWTLDYGDALAKGKVRLLSASNADCLIYQEVKNDRLIPEYSYFIPSLKKILLVFGGKDHGVSEFRQFCHAIIPNAKAAKIL